MRSQSIKYELTWFEKEGDALVGECSIKGISLSELQQLFKQLSNVPMVYCYPVLPCHVKYLQKFVQHKIDLDVYDYFIEGYS